MLGARLPDVPDPTKIAKSGSEVVKAIAQGGVGVGVDLIVGAEQILFNTIEGTIGAVTSGVRELINMAKSDINLGKTTAERVRADIDQACNSVLSQVDQTIGGEVVRKFKSEVEKQLR